MPSPTSLRCKTDVGAVYSNRPLLLLPIDPRWAPSIPVGAPPRSGPLGSERRAASGDDAPGGAASHSSRPMPRWGDEHVGFCNRGACM